jgi:hypothetical protein
MPLAGKVHRRVFISNAEQARFAELQRKFCKWYFQHAGTPAAQDDLEDFEIRVTALKEGRE